MKVENRLGEILHERGLSQLVFAVDADVHLGQLSRIKLGKVTPSLATALKISRALGVSVEDVFELTVEES